MSGKSTFDEAPDAQSIDKARQIFIEGISNPVFEIFDKTHTGFSYYYLYELRGKKLYLIAKTFAIDGNSGDDITIANKHYDRSFELKPIYKDLNGDGFTDIELAGNISMDDIYDKHTHKEVKARKILLYDRRLKKFREDLNRRIGFLKTDY